MMEEEFRPLSAEELGLLSWLLENGAPEARGFIPLLPHISAKGDCKCGCPSISFSFPVDLPMIEVRSRIVADFTGESEGVEGGVGLILFAGSGVLSYLDVYSFGGHEKPFPLPKLETLRPFDPPSSPGKL